MAIISIFLRLFQFFMIPGKREHILFLLTVLFLCAKCFTQQFKSFNSVIYYGKKTFA